MKKLYSEASNLDGVIRDMKALKHAFDCTYYTHAMGGMDGITTDDYLEATNTLNNMYGAMTERLELLSKNLYSLHYGGATD